MSISNHLVYQLFTRKKIDWHIGYLWELFQKKSLDHDDGVKMDWKRENLDIEARSKLAEELKKELH